MLERSGELCEEDQRRLVRFVIQDGNGADVIFAAGTTGEWDRLPASLQRRVVRICAEEVAKANPALGEHEKVEVWAGITAHAPAATLENLEAAIAAGADAAVLAPLSIRGLADPVGFVAREVLEPFGHSNLNRLEPFRAKVPTTENLCIEIYNRLERGFRAARVEKVRLEETMLNAFEYAGENGIERREDR